MSNKEIAMLKLINLQKEYVVSTGNVLALKGVDLEFRKNEFVSILGPSGCGKTTMLNLIGGLDKYTSGDLIIDGTSTKNFSDGDWDSYRNNSVGFVFQSYNLIPHLTILGNVELALTLSGVSKTERTQRATEALEKVGLQDHITKKPNQLSGGQMQRVAIARALINNPDIILADEPTGALDSETSVQIMDLLKEVAKERLVIMVTHNPELADDYSTRIVKFKDGLLISDSNPFTSVNKEEAKFVPKKTAMPFKMALELSFKNLLSKKARTMITAFAGSIGIIGIACVLALSNGFQTYVDKMQTDMMSEYPIELEMMSPDMNAMMGMFGGEIPTKFPDIKDLIVNDTTGMLSEMLHFNQFTKEFQDYILNVDPSLINDINMMVNFNLPIYKTVDGINKVIETRPEDPDSAMDSMMGSSSNFGQLVENLDFFKNQYDVIHGEMATEKHELVLLVDEYNMISNMLLEDLGIILPGEKVDKISFEDIVGQTYRWVPNQVVYSRNPADPTKFNTQASTLNYDNFNHPDSLELEIVGIVRINESTTSGSMSSTIGYTSALTEHVIGYEIAEATKSDIVKQVEATYGLVDPFTGDKNDPLDMLAGYTHGLAYFGATTEPTSIKIYPKTFAAKGLIKDYIEDYNDSLEIKEDPITKLSYEIIYFDAMEMMISGMNTVIASVSYVLIAFTSISLIVSSVMIGIITYVSVIERTKEIGVLRSIGARKKDISRVFNAETIIIGFTAGAIAILFTYIISIPTNIIVNALVPDMQNIANLNPIAAVILVIISITLTLIAGLIPSRVAANKDPVTALRSE